MMTKTLIVLAAALSAVACASQPLLRLDDYMPMEAGRSLDYTIEETSTTRLPGQEPAESNLSSLQTESFRPATAEETALLPAGASGAITKISSRRPQNSENAAETRAVMSRDQEALMLHAWLAPTGATEQYTPPLRILPVSFTTGTTWEMGTLRHQGMVFPTNAKIIGIEDLKEGTSVFGDCLHVSYTTSRVEGEVATGQGMMQVSSGTTQIDRWYARGTGLVKETATTVLVLQDASGESVESSATRVQKIASPAVDSP
ncbi:MAG TPA: hypothetical protein VFG76_05105 [Candidatus Polarisedimenticolia bacterium]|nr:hypothetical protein [Candidatus Polarisedimenticolia bacterium]